VAAENRTPENEPVAMTPPARGGPDSVAAEVDRQRQRALKQARRVKGDQRVFLGGLRRREIAPLRLLRGDDHDHEQVAGGTRIDTLLRAIPGIGTVSAMNVLIATGVPAVKLRELSHAQREDIAKAVAALGVSDPIDKEA
jgi:hypothetical protein